MRNITERKIKIFESTEVSILEEKIARFLNDNKLTCFDAKFSISGSTRGVLLDYQIEAN